MKKVLVVREAGEFDERLRRAGLATLNFAPIRTEPVGDLAELDARLDALDAYDGLLLTSPQAAAIFSRAGARKGAPRYAGRVYVLGERTRKMLETAGFDLVFRDAANTAADLLAAFAPSEFAGRKFLFLRGERAARTIPETLGALARLDETILYRTVERPPDETQRRSIGAALEGREIGWICFFSPAGVDGLVKAFGAQALAGAKLAAIGATTAGRLAAHGFAADFVAAKASAKNFAVELSAILTDN